MGRATGDPVGPVNGSSLGSQILRIGSNIPLRGHSQGSVGDDFGLLLSFFRPAGSRDRRSAFRLSLFPNQDGVLPDQEFIVGEGKLPDC
jgi:hypothetical protein